MGYCRTCGAGFEGRHLCPLERQPSLRLANHIHARMLEAGMEPDVYDGDFLLGVIYEWLERNDAVITGGGVKVRT